MKITRDEWLELKNRVTTLEINSGFVKHKDLVTCEKCGCLMYKWSAAKGKSKIKTRGECFKEEYIFTPYYCKKDTKGE